MRITPSHSVFGKAALKVCFLTALASPRVFFSGFFSFHFLFLGFGVRVGFFGLVFLVRFFFFFLVYLFVREIFC